MDFRWNNDFRDFGFDGFVIMRMIGICLLSKSFGHTFQLALEFGSDLRFGGLGLAFTFFGFIQNGR